MNFLNLHMLFTFAAANPNRDDAGSPKSISYGGATRSRISSQAMTRPKRLAFEADLHGETTYRSVFTAQRITDLTTKILAEQGHILDEAGTEQLGKYSAEMIKKLTHKDKEKAKKAGAKKRTDDEAAESDDLASAEEPESKATLVWLAEYEIVNAARQFAERIADKAELSIAPDAFLTGRQTRSLSVAAFGRMFAQRPDLSVEAAVQRSHAFTTHETANEVDYFTAVDDLRASDSKGAAHLNIAELTAGVYYWHANIDIRQIWRTWDTTDLTDAPERLTRLFEALFLALPTGRQNTTAHHTLPSAVLAIPARLPASLQTAFEAPVRPERNSGLLQPSITALLAEHTRTTAAMPSRFSDGRYAGTATIPAPTSGLHPAASLDELAIWCADHVLAGQAAAR